MLVPPHGQEAINLLEPMTNDPVNYVRQGALIASALIMIQQSEVTCPKVRLVMGGGSREGKAGLLPTERLLKPPSHCG